MKMSCFVLLVIGVIMPLSSCQANSDLPCEPEDTGQMERTAWPEDTNAPEYSFRPEDFVGEWVATEVAAVPEFTQSDYYPEKYIGHIIHIEENYFYMDFWEGIIKKEDCLVDYYSIEEWNQREYEILYKVYFPYNWEPMLVLYGNGEIKQKIGIIVDLNTLICKTGSGYYQYERIKE